MANTKQNSNELPKGQAYNIRLKIGDDDYVVFMGTTNNPLVNILSRVSRFMTEYLKSTDKSYVVDAVNFEQLKNLKNESKA